MRVSSASRGRYRYVRAFVTAVTPKCCQKYHTKLSTSKDSGEVWNYQARTSQRGARSSGSCPYNTAHVSCIKKRFDDSDCSIKVKIDKRITYLVEHGRVLLIKPPDRVAALTGGDVSIEGGQVEHGIPRREHRRRDRCR